MKLFEMKNVRYLSLAFALVMAFGLFAGCSSKNTEPSAAPSDQVSEEPSQEPSTEPSEEPSEESSQDPADDGSGADGDSDALRNVVGKVTKIDGNTVILTVYTTDNEEIESYSKVDMSQYSATEETEEVDLTDAMIALAGDDGMSLSEISQIKEGDMLLLSFDGDDGTLLQAVIYAA